MLTAKMTDVQSLQLYANAAFAAGTPVKKA